MNAIWCASVATQDQDGQMLIQPEAVIRIPESWVLGLNGDLLELMVPDQGFVTVRWRDAQVLETQDLPRAHWLCRWMCYDNYGGEYHRPRDQALLAWGGRMVHSSNWQSGDQSFSPTDVWEFPDRSQLEVAYQCAQAL